MGKSENETIVFVLNMAIKQDTDRESWTHRSTKLLHVPIPNWYPSLFLGRGITVKDEKDNRP